MVQENLNLFFHCDLEVQKPFLLSIKKEKLPITYYNQAKSWMTGEILHDALGFLNHKLKTIKVQSVLLFMDIVGCHTTDLAEKYNILGTFYTTQYHFVLAKIEYCTTASDVVKPLTILCAY